MPESLQKISPPHVGPDFGFVGGSDFGRTNKINASRTFNLFISDNFLTDTYGYVKVDTLGSNQGRSIFTSTRGKFLLSVVDERVYRLTPINLLNSPTTVFQKTHVGTVATFTGSVFVDENEANQIAICDQSKLYIYNWNDNTFQEAILPDGVIPGYVSFQNGFFLITDRLSSNWYLSDVNDGLNWFWGGPSANLPVNGALQTKPDLGVAIIRVAGAGNLIFVMGSTVTEPWSNVPSTLFPYQRSTSSNIDYGCVNPETLSSLDQITAWVAINDRAGITIMYSTGSAIQQVSTEGYNFKFQKLSEPQKCFAFFIKISGHLLYQLTFYGKDDNFSLIYDFTTQKFFDATDEHFNYHILRDVAYFEGRYYGIAYRDGNLYQLGEDLYTYNYGEMGEFEKPRVRITPNLRTPNTAYFTVTNIEILMEQGNDPLHIIPSPSYQPRVGLSVSKNGGYDFGEVRTIPLKRLAKRSNIVKWWRLGRANEMVFKFSFFSRGPINASSGIVNVWQ